MKHAARRLYAASPLTCSYRQLARVREDGYPIPVSVIYIPRDTSKIRAEIRHAINWYFDGEMDYQFCLENSVDAIMTLFRIPKPKKSPRKLRGKAL